MASKGSRLLREMGGRFETRGRTSATGAGGRGDIVCEKRRAKKTGEKDGAERGRSRAAARERRARRKGGTEYVGGEKTCVTTTAAGNPLMSLLIRQLGANGRGVRGEVPRAMISM
jgi:hypothetical protein